MSYTNEPDHAATYSVNSGSVFTLTGSTIADDAKVTGDVYAKRLNIISGATATLSDIVIGEGGIVSAYPSATSKNGNKNVLLVSAAILNVNGATIESGGYGNGGNWSNFTVESGGSFRLAGGVISNLTVQSGGSFSGFGGGACAFYGPLNIQSGAIFQQTVAGVLSTYDVYTDADGWVHNFGAVTGAVHLRRDIKVKDPLMSSFLYVSANVAISGGSANDTGLPILIGGTAIDFTASKAELNRTGLTLGGATTTISNYIYIINGAYASTATAAVGTFSVTNGVVSDLALKAGYTKSMVDLTLISGMNAASPVISSGGSLFLKDGGIATGATISSAGSLTVSSGGTATGATISSAGSLTVSSGGTAADAAVRSGALVISRGGTATDVVWTPTEGMIYVYDGAHLTFANELTGVYYGSSNVLQSHETEMTNLTLDAAAKSACVMNGGKVTDTTVNNGYLYVWHGGEASGITVSGTNYLSSFVVRGGHVSGLTVSGLHGGTSDGFDRLVAIASSGAFIEDATIQWGRLGMSQGATVSGATVTGGALDIYDPAAEWHYDRPAMLVNEATVTAGRIFFRGSNASGANIVIANTDDTANHIQNGAYVSGLTIRGGKMVEHYNNTLVDGDLRPFIEDVNVSGGVLSIGWGAAKDVRITGGDIAVFGVADHPSLIEDLAVSGGKVTVASNGALISGATFYGSGIYDSSVGSLVYTSMGSMDIKAGASARDIVLSGGFLTVSGGATLTNVTVTASGGSVYNDKTKITTFQGGKFTVSNATVYNLVVSGAKVANNAASLNTNAVISGGLVYGILKSNTVYMGGNAKWNEVTVSLGNIYMNGGGSVTNLTQVGGQVIARGVNAFVSGADVTGSGQIYAQNGGRLYDITVSDGGYLEIRYQNAGSSGHFAQNVTVGSRGSANVMRYGTLRDVTIENGGLVRVGNNGPDYISRGYVSGALIRSGGNLVVSSGAWVSGGIAEKGAKLDIYLSPEGDETYASIQSNGVDFTVSNTVVTGLTEINSGTTLLLFSNTVFDASQVGSIGEGGNIVASATTTATNATVASGGVLTVSAGGSATDVTVNEGGAAVVHIGEGTYAEVGTVTVDGTTITGLAEGITSGVTIAVDNGIVFNDQTLLAGGGVQIEGGGSVGGLTATGGTLTLKGGYMSGANIGADVTVNATGCTISGGTVSATLNVNGGTLYTRSDTVLHNVVINSGAVLSGNFVSGHAAQIKNATVEAGGKLDLTGGAAYVSGLLVKEGATFKTAANNVLVGTDINIAAGAWNVLPTEAVVDGVLNANGSKFLGVGAFYFYDGFTVSNAECNIYMYLSNGAQARDITATTSNGVALQTGGYAYNVKVGAEDGGNFFIHQYSGNAGVALGGAETDIAQGKVYNVAGTFDKPYDWYVDKGVVKQLSLGSGATYAYDVQRMHLREGIKADAPVVSSGGTLYISSGVEVTDAKLFNAGGIRIYDGALLSGTTATGGMMWVSNTGVIKDTLMSGWAIMTVSEGGYVSGVTLDRAGHKTSGANLRVEAANAVAEDVTISSGAILWVSNGVASDVTVLSSGSAILANGTISGAVLNDTVLNNGSNPHTALYLTNGLVNDVDVIRGNIHAQGTGTVTNLRQSGAQVIMRGASTYVSGAVVTGVRDGRTTDHELGRLYFQDDAVGSDITVGSGGMIYAYAFTSRAEVGYDKNQRAYDIDIIDGGSAVASRYGNFYDIRIHDGGRMTIASAGYASGVTIDEGASAFITANGSADIGATSVWNMNVSSGAAMKAGVGAQLVNLVTKAGAQVTVTRDEEVATFQGDKTSIAANTVVYSSGTVSNVLGFSVANGVVKNLGADGKAYRLAFGSGMEVQNATVKNGWRISAFGDAVVTGGVVNGNGGAAVVVLRDSSYATGITLMGSGNSGLLNVWDNASTEDIIVSNGGVLRIQSAGVVATGTVVSTGGKLDFAVGAGKIEDTILKAGAILTLVEGANTGERLTLDVADGNTITINDLALVNADTEIVLTGEAAGTYTIATAGSTDKYINCGEWGLYDDRIKAGESIIDAFTGFSYEFNADGTQITVGTVTMTDQAAAGDITGGTELADGGRAAKWTANTTTGGSGSVIKVATSTITGDAWLEINGTNLGGTTLYGAEAGFTKGVNLYATGDAVVNNLAAGATSGGTVESVKLTVDSATVGLAYAGGFGNVTSATETLIGEGAAMQKDFYAGTLANYAKTNTVTSQGNITLDIAAGEFSGNIYGAASVKAGAAASVVHTVQNVTINVKDGETKKGNQACLFAGGYATGSTTNKVYTVENIDVTIDGGSWGTAAGGRGVFGGIFASNVTAEAGNVSITIDGGTMGNVYGGGWSQKGGASIVGDVDITVTGGTIANVFGGGAHSATAPGGTTSAGDVAITVAGGNITNAIYAKGQADGDSVTGTANVIFTGANDYTCDVFGYSYVGGTGNSEALTFNDYTGTFTGAVGGFEAVVISGDTALTFATAAEKSISNTAWAFDFADRAEALIDTAALSGVSFAESTKVAVSFANADQAAAGWSIATAANASNATFDLYIGTSTIVEDLDYDTEISGGDWDGWKFTSVDGTLKFAKITA